MQLFWSIKYELIRIIVTWINTVNIFYTYGWSGSGWGYRKISRTGHNLIITDTRYWIYGDSVYYCSVYTYRGLIFSTKKWGTLLSTLHLFLKADKKTKEQNNREGLLYHKGVLINTLWYQCTPNWPVALREKNSLLSKWIWQKTNLHPTPPIHRSKFLVN